MRVIEEAVSTPEHWNCGTCWQLRADLYVTNGFTLDQC